EAELASWLAERTAEDAARELLAFATGESAAIRTATIPVVSRLGAAAEPAWREALDRPELRCYAKPALLAQLAEGDPGAAVPAAPPAADDIGTALRRQVLPTTPAAAADPVAD